MDLVEAKSAWFVKAHATRGAGPVWRFAARLIARHVTLLSWRHRPRYRLRRRQLLLVESLAKQYPDVRFMPSTVLHARVDRMFEQRLHGVEPCRCSRRSTMPRDVSASLVLLMDVLEHVGDDHGMLRGLASHPSITARTRMLITVPAYAALFPLARSFPRSLPPASTTSFALLAQARLTDWSSGHLFASLVPVRLLQVLAERIVPPPQEPTSLATW